MRCLWLAVVGAAACSEYRPPCSADDPALFAATPDAPASLRLLGDDRIRASWLRPGAPVNGGVPVDGGVPLTAEARMFALDGTVLAAHTVALPSFGAVPPEFAPAIEWADSGAALLRSVSDGAMPIRTHLEFTFLSDAAPQIGPISLTETECADCFLLFQLRYLDGGFLILYSHADTPGPFVGPTAPFAFLVLGLDGKTRAAGSLDWLSATDVALYDFAFEVRSDAAVLATYPQQLWLIDGAANRLTAPLPLSPGAQVAWDLGASEIEAVWTDDDGNLLMQRFRFSGEPLGEVERISDAGVAFAVGDSADRTGMVFGTGSLGEASLYFAVATHTGHKIGGDLPLRQPLLPPGFGSLLVRDPSGSFLWFEASAGAVLRQKISCVR
jgi:hypothetical protein